MRIEEKRPGIKGEIRPIEGKAAAGAVRQKAVSAANRGGIVIDDVETRKLVVLVWASLW